MVEQGAHTTLVNQVSPWSSNPAPTDYLPMEPGRSTSYLPLSDSRSTVSDTIQNANTLSKRRLDEEPGPSRPTNRQRYEAPLSTNEPNQTTPTSTQAVSVTCVAKPTGMHAYSNRSLSLIRDPPTTSQEGRSTTEWGSD